jgi:hypothetical protein
MKWMDARKARPNHGEEVLIRSRGIYNLAAFKEDTQEFILKNGAKYSLATDNVEWIRLAKNSELNQ